MRVAGTMPSIVMAHNRTCGGDMLYPTCSFLMENNCLLQINAAVLFTSSYDHCLFCLHNVHHFTLHLYFHLRVHHLLPVYLSHMHHLDLHPSLL